MTLKERMDEILEVRFGYNQALTDLRAKLGGQNAK